MATPTIPDRSNILRQPGFWYWTPTNLSAEATWGTQLGFSERGAEIVSNYRTITEEGEEGFPVIKAFIGDLPRLVVTLKNWDANTVALAFPGFNSSAKVNSPGTINPGTVLSTATYSKSLLFVPRDGGEENNVFLAQLASPATDSGGRYVLSAGEDTNLTIAFDLFQKGSGTESYRCYYAGPLSGAILL